MNGPQDDPRITRHGNPKTGFASRDRGFGALVDAGPCLLALPPTGELIVLAPSGQECREVAKLTVAESPTYAHPVVSGNRIYIKDEDAVTLWTIP